MQRRFGRGHPRAVAPPPLPLLSLHFHHVQPPILQGPRLGFCQALLPLSRRSHGSGGGGGSGRWGADVGGVDFHPLGSDAASDKVPSGFVSWTLFFYWAVCGNNYVDFVLYTIGTERRCRVGAPGRRLLGRRLLRSQAQDVEELSSPGRRGRSRPERIVVQVKFSVAETHPPINIY